MERQNECLRCGVCCEKGGPALHIQDLPLVQKKHLEINQLITIRKSELAHDPVTDDVKPVTSELVKIRGDRGEWCCCFYDRKKKGCGIYGHRPLACRTLKCWDTDDILKLSGRDLITRLDIMEKDNPLRAIIMEHEHLFPCPDLVMLSQDNSHSLDKIIPELEKIVVGDLHYRSRIISAFNLSVEEEAFYFGRPVFQLIEPFGFMIQETAKGITVFR